MSNIFTIIWEHSNIFGLSLFNIGSNGPELQHIQTTTVESVRDAQIDIQHDTSLRYFSDLPEEGQTVARVSNSAAYYGAYDDTNVHNNIISLAVQDQPR